MLNRDQFELEADKEQVSWNQIIFFCHQLWLNFEMINALWGSWNISLLKKKILTIFPKYEKYWQDGGMEAIWVELAERLLQEKPTERSEILK